jgi:hypothetical protein
MALMAATYCVAGRVGEGGNMGDVILRGQLGKIELWGFLDRLDRFLYHDRETRGMFPVSAGADAKPGSVGKFARRSA